MPKSNYPNKLDSSIEIPAVRDNIIEVGSDVLNSMRSALFQIERTLGINPQGASGNTVADRLNRVLDGNGNLLKDSFDRADLLSGPITNDEVAKNAAINESKLRLNYPTNLLQDEISQLIKQVDTILATVEELAVLFNSHVHTSALNRHKGLAITIDAIDSSTSSEGVTSIGSKTAQGAFETIFSSHINYDGSDISISNRSHEAEQLFFDTADVSSYVDSDDVQGAIEEVLTYAVGQLDEHQNIHHDNGISRTGELTTASSEGEGLLLIATADIQYNARGYGDTAQDAIVNFSSSQVVPDLAISRSDILQITDSSGISTYQISKVVYSEDGSEVIGVMVFARFGTASDPGATAKVYQNINAKTNYGGLLTSVREYEVSGSGTGYTNADTLQVANPNAATIITKGIRPSEITGLGNPNRHFSISVDGASSVTLDVYDSNVITQTIDTIIRRLNEQFASNALSVSAYRVDYDEASPSEVALVHSIESTATSAYTLMVARGSDDAIDSLGLSSYEDYVVDATLGTNYYIQGKAYSGLGAKLSATGLELLSGTGFVTSASIDFVELGLAYGDLLVIANSQSDDGTYMIQYVDTSLDGSSRFRVDLNQLTASSWAGETSAEAEFYVLNNSVSLRGLEFDELVDGSSKAVVADVFMDYNRNIFYNRRLEYGGISEGAVDHLVAIVDFYGDPSVYSGLSDEGLYMELSEAGNVLLSLDGGDPIELSGLRKSYVEVKSGKYDIKLKLYIEDSLPLITYVTAEGAVSILIYGYSGVNEEENLLLSRIHYESAVSRISGAGTECPRPFSKLRRGTTGGKDLGTDAIFSTQQRPLLETRSNGVIHGLEVSTSVLAAADEGVAGHESINVNGHYVIDISGGICYVKGRRFEISESLNLITGVESPAGSGTTTDKFFVALDQWGGLVFASATEGPGGLVCESPFDPYDYCVLCTVEYNGDGAGSGDPPVATDLRLFIDQLDLKLLNSITVSPQRGMGHFTSINEALKYAKRFSQAYTSAGVPTIHLKSGVHRLNVDYGVAYAGVTDQIATDENYNQGIWINFPVTIEGEGDSTVLDISDSYTDYPISSDDRATEAGNAKNGNRIWVAGAGTLTTPAGDSDVLSSGFVTLKDFRMRMSWISFIDPDIKDGDGNKLNCGLNIDNVTFDWSENPTFAAERFGVSLWDRETAGVCGNFSITNCQFLNSSIYMGPDASDCRNISILNNVFRGTGIVAGDGEDNYAIYQSGAGNIFSIDDCPAVNNVQILGNINADNDGLTTAYIDNDGNHEWGDRISRVLSVGGDLIVRGTHNQLGPVSITTDDGEPEYALSISKGSANSVEMIKLENRDASGTGYPTWSLYHQDDGGFGIGSSADYDRLRLDSGSKNVGLSTSGPRSRLHIMTDAGEVDASYTAQLEQYHLLLHQSGNNDTSQVGLGFRISADDTGQIPGAAITHQRTGSQSKGKLHFKTKTTTANGTGLSTHMTISDDGNVGIGTSAPEYQLSLSSNNNSTSVALYEGEDSANGGDLRFFKSRHSIFGSGIIPEQSDAGDTIGNIFFSKGVEDIWGQVSYEKVSRIECRQSTGGGGEIRLSTGIGDGSGTTITRLLVKDDGAIDLRGDVDIGGALTVDGGGYHASEAYNVIKDHVRVEASGNTNVKLEINSGSGKEAKLEFYENDAFRYNIFSDGDDNNFYIGSYNSPTPLIMLKSGGGLGLGNEDTGLPGGSWGHGLRIKQQDNSGSDGVTFEAALSTKSWAIWYDDNGNFRFAKDSNGNGTYQYKAEISDASDAGPLDFTGQHRSMVADGESLSSYADKIGMIVVSSGEYYNLSVSAGQGFEAPDHKPQINESLPKVTLSIEKNQKSVFGVISEVEDLELIEGREGVRSRTYFLGAWGTNFEAPEGDERLIINSLGEGAIWVCNINGNLENGDYITSCEVPGYGMMQDDDLLHNYTVAKITQDCDFDLNSNVYDCVEFDFEGQTYKKAFVGCTYHCG